MTIAFVINSEKIDFYLFKCLEYIHTEIENVKITLYFEEPIKKNEFKFNWFVKLVDSKFNNFRYDAFNSIEKNDLTKKLNVKIVTKIDELKIHDIIILENKYVNVSHLKKFTKLGFITLYLSEKLVINDLLFKKYIRLIILYQDINSTEWSVIGLEMLKKEKGIKNCLTKLSFYFAIYLAKILRQNTLDKHYNKIKPQSNDFINQFLLTLYYLKLASIILKRKFSKSRLNWKIGIEHNDEIKFLKQPQHSFWADPFIIKHKNEYIIYFEELKKNGIGRISCLVLDSDFNILKKREIIDKDYHLSFPNVFKVENNYFMIPESSQTNSLQLYECIKFPFEWEFKMNLISDIKLLDAIWIFHDNMYWILANKIDGFEHENNERLYIYYSKDLFSNKWTPHSNNPVITNASLARNAGQIYLSNNKMYRISQNCSETYGGNLVVNEITELTINKYSEIKMNEILPPNGILGKHTMNSCDDVTVVDLLFKE
ncbi:hypothetical protein ACFQ0I_10985 [Mariniflexile aquimaris]|uniref:Glucosamine inositolphosphorylceramide transferase 1 N-terminal domain-containing protein n=1 Tax=Mariniflexile aquimaris TaxID=881009 RepID=A0ABW3BU49_9FLAO